MFTTGQQVKGRASIGGIMQFTTLVVLDAYDNGTFCGEVLDHPDEDMIGDEYDDLNSSEFELVASPSANSLSGGFVNTPAPSINSNSYSTEQLLVMGII